jgi:hypothetical protein
VDPLVPGVYNIIFRVQDSAGLNATVVRKVVVKARCPAGEKLCFDGVKCSKGGACLEDHTIAVNRVVGEEEAALMKPPTIVLLKNSHLPGFLSLPMFTQFDR